MAPHRARRTLLAVAALLAAACSRDTDLPPRSTAPEVSGLSPASAFADEVVEVAGARFGADPADVLVQFPGAAVRPFEASGALLRVRVPADAGSGPITVSTAAGTSAPSASFTYLGLGQLRGTTVAGYEEILQRPVAIYAPGGQPIVDSGLVSALVWPDGVGSPWNGNPRAAVRGIVRAAASADALFVVVHGELRRIDAATGWVTATRATGMAEFPGAITHVAGVRCADAVVRDLVVLESPVSPGPGPAAPTILSWFSTWDAATLAPVEPWSGTNHAYVPQSVDAGGGLAVGTEYAGLLGYVPSTYDVGSNPPARTELPPVPPPPGGGNTPVLVGPVTAGLRYGNRIVAAPLSDGTVGVWDLDGGPAWVGAVDTHFENVATEVAVTSGGTLVATNGQEGLVVGASLLGTSDTWRVTWGYRATSPSALVADGPMVWLARSDANELVALDETTGSTVAIRSLDPLPSALAFVPGGAGSVFGLGVDTVAVATQLPGAYVEVGLATAMTGALAVHADGTKVAPQRLLFDAGRGRTWVAGASELTTGYLDVSYAYSGAPMDLALAGGAVIVPTWQGVSVLDDAGWHAGVAMAPQTWIGTAVGPDGRVLMDVNLAGGYKAQVWTPAALAAGGTPELDVFLPYPGTGVAWVDGEPWVFFGASNGSSEGGRLAADGNLVDRRPVSLPPRLVPSPNGRTLAAVGPDGRSVVIHAVDPAAGFPLVGAVQLEGSVQQVVFDETGERLFAVTNRPARVWTVR